MYMSGNMMGPFHGSCADALAPVRADGGSEDGPCVLCASELFFEPFGGNDVADGVGDALLVGE
jgi:hypothetical protein